MKLGVKKLSTAVRLGLSLGAVIAMGAAGSAFAQDTGTQNNNTDQGNTKTLQTVTVTGSRIRRVDLETSNPVVTIDRAAIVASGKLTLGELVQDLPAITGGQTNPQVNNGGGGGSSSIGLRGLGSARTLVLVDGHRIVNGDPNSIPSNMIERVEVLTTGASAIYGSDAIAGVVNFILRKDYQGAQFTANYGESDHHDGQQNGYSFTFGQTGDKGSIIGGVEYNKFNQVEAGNRSFSKNSVSRIGSTSSPIGTFIGGSPTSPYGNIQIPTTGPKAGALAAAFPGCSSGTLARNPGASGTNPVADYHCYQNTGPNSDKYNYATVNLILTPQERTNAFVNGTYNLGDHVSAYMDAYYNKTSSGFQLAPGVYGSPYGAVISKDSYYNPFGVDYNSNANNFRARLSALGNRFQKTAVNTGQISTGLKGDFTVLDQAWNWSVGLDYGHTSTTFVTGGLPNLSVLNPGTGPSFLDPATGVVTCGVPGTPIAGCTPFNAFNLDSPESKAALAKAATPAISTNFSIEKVWHADVTGGVVDLPAGTLQLAAGLQYRTEYTNAYVDPLLNINPDTGLCVLGSQCSAALTGGYNVKAGYAEAFIPVLKDLPFAKAVNVTIGDRYSRFSSFGSTNDFKFAVEWKPIDDLLLRGTMADVFRAPNIGEVFGAPSSDAPNIKSDPCDGYTGTPVNPACVNVKPDGTFVNKNVAEQSQLTTILAGSSYAGFPIKPEQGKTFDLGAVYSPSWLPGLSTSVDFWHLYLNDTIVSVGAQNVLNLCSAGQTQYCKFIKRTASGPNQGQLASNFVEPTGNLGSTSTGGIDFSANYKLPELAIGQFRVGLNTTYLKYYNQQTAPGTDANITYTDAGHYQQTGSPASAACPLGNVDGCLFPRWRGTGTLDWQSGGWSASYRLRYIGAFRMGSENAIQATYPFGQGVSELYKDYGATLYSDVQIGYTIQPLNTRVDFGVRNLADKKPPVFYANNTTNANTDPASFDLMGRYFWGRVTVTF